MKPDSNIAPDDPRWTAVRARDPNEDGSFVYAVLTTGVYCRPNCPARRPHIANVRMFDTTAEAERAGFRACKRCKPSQQSPANRMAGLIALACRAIEDAESTPDFAAIATQAGMSRHHFHRSFKSVIGMTPGAYAKAVRAKRVMAEMSAGAPVTQAIYAAGYGSSSRFYTEVAPRLGMKPRNFSKAGAGETIRFAVGLCSLGHILVAATDAGVCSIQFGDDPQALVDALQATFDRAELIGGDADFERLVAEVVGYVEEPSRPFAIPLDVRGTAFQLRVWDALRHIPPGTTVTYADLAATIGAPGAVRAVASACAKNSLAVAIPCHRVVRTGGALAGYRWGVERKAALIAREAR